MSGEPLSKDMKFRLRHTMLPVSNIHRTVDFYTRYLGMDIMRVREAPERHEITVYLGYGSEDDAPALELVQQGKPDDTTPVPRWAGHMALCVSDLRELCRMLTSEGVQLVSQPRALRAGSPDLVAWIRDPDGYSIELTERHSRTGPPVKREAVDL